MRKKNSLLKKRFLIVGPFFLEWDLGTYLSNLLADKGIDHRTFAYGGFRTREEANKQLLKAVERYKPHIVLGVKMDRMYGTTIRALREKGVFTALWMVDCFTDNVPGWIKPLVRESDLFMVTAKGMVPKYRSLSSTPVYWMYEGAYLPAFSATKLSAHAAKKIYSSKVAFIGRIYQPPVEDRKIAKKRERFFRKIGEKYQMKVWGVQGDYLNKKRWDALPYLALEWPAYNNEVVKICQVTDIILGVNTVNNVELYFSNRTFLTLVSGGFHITHYVPGLETMFRNHEHLVWFKSDEECLDLIDHYLKRPRMREKISRKGRAYARRRFGMKRQLNKILEVIHEHYE